MIELVIIVCFVVPIALWQFYDLDKAKKETARKRLEAAEKDLAKAKDGSAPASSENQ